MSNFKNVGKMSPRISGFHFHQKFQPFIPLASLVVSNIQNHILIYVIFSKRCVLTCRYQTIIALITPGALAK